MVMSVLLHLIQRNERPDFMKKHFLLALYMLAAVVHGQPAVTLDGFAEIAGTKPCDNRDLGKNIYAIGALYWTIGKGWATTIEAEFNQRELALTQLFVSKEFADYAKLSIGQITVPIGHTVPYNRPENHLTVLLPESEGKMMPYHWDQPGVSVLANAGHWAYSMMWLVDRGGMACALRLDCKRVDGLRVGVSGYYGKTYLYQFDNDSLRYDMLGNLLVVGADYDCERGRVLSHGYATYSHSKGGFGHDGVCAGAELGYDVLAGNARGQRLVPFARYDYYNTTIAEDLAVNKVCTHRLSFGVSYSPISQVFVKAEYAHCHRHVTGGENMLMVGVAVSGALDLLDRK